MLRELGAALVTGSLALLACSGPGTPETAPRKQPDLPPVPEAKAESELELESEPEPDPESVIELEAPDSELSGNVLEPTTIEAGADVEVSWREVARFDAPLRFVDFAGGALARTDTGYLAATVDGLAPQPGLELPADVELFGHWPDDVWYLQRTELDAKAKAKAGGASFEYRVMHRDETGAWVPIQHRNASAWTGDDMQLHESWRGGVLLRSESLLRPIGARGNPFKIGPRMGKQIIDVFESRAGDLYVISARAKGYYVHGKCKDFACVEATAKKLPFGTAWKFTAQAPRHRHGLSVLASIEADGVEAHYLLHFGINGWTLDALVDRPTGLWSTDEGGLWLPLASDQLWFRSPEEEWVRVDLPDHAQAISAAMLDDRGELWLAASVGGEGVVFATAAAGPIPAEATPE